STTRPVRNSSAGAPSTSARRCATPGRFSARRSPGRAGWPTRSRPTSGPSGATPPTRARTPAGPRRCAGSAARTKRAPRSTGPWAYRLRLREVPDAETRVRIARAAAGVIDPARFGDSPPWLWSGAFVLVRLRPGEETDAAATLDALTRVVDAVHGVVPLAEAV